jgi:hypothetical protein
MGKARIDAWIIGSATALVALMIATLYNTVPPVRQMLWWRVSIIVAVAALVMSTLRLLAPYWAPHVPRLYWLPDTVDSAALYLASRFSSFAERHPNETGDALAQRFWKQYPFKQLHRVVRRIEAIAPGINTSWETTYPGSPERIKGIASQLEAAANRVPSGTPLGWR